MHLWFVALNEFMMQVLFERLGPGDRLDIVGEVLQTGDPKIVGDTAESQNQLVIAVDRTRGSRESTILRVERQRLILNDTYPQSAQQLGQWDRYLGARTTGGCVVKLRVTGEVGTLRNQRYLEFTLAGEPTSNPDTGKAAADDQNMVFRAFLLSDSCGCHRVNHKRI